ncbi:MAG: hypothetical protein K2G42_04005 [Clostridia bacterium]|nr:hypothetical protein [Clostridia bacterium]
MLNKNNAYRIGYTPSVAYRDTFPSRGRQEYGWGSLHFGRGDKRHLTTANGGASPQGEAKKAD